MRATLEKMVAPKNRVLRILGGYQGSAEGEIARRPRLFPECLQLKYNWAQSSQQEHHFIFKMSPFMYPYYFVCISFLLSLSLSLWQGCTVTETPDQNFTDFTKCLQIVISMIKENELQVK